MMGSAGMKNTGLVVLAVAVLVMGWRLVEVTREKTSIGPIQEKWRRPTPFALLLPRI